MEVPDLGTSSIWCLNHEVPVVDEVEVSVGFHLGDNVEWSFNIETEVFVEFSLLWLFWVLISVDDIPLLVKSFVSAPGQNVSILAILCSLDIKYLSSLIHNIVSLIFPQLPPS